VLSEQQVRQILSKVEDPELHRPITDLDMVRGVVVDEDRVRVSIALTVPGCPLKATIHADVTDVLRAAGVNEVGVDFTTMSEDERAALQERLHPFPEMRDVFARSRVLAVASGKGGVGKSSISANLAIALAARGFSAALIDADVYGFSIPRMFGLDRRPVIIDRMIVPPQAHGVSFVRHTRRGDPSLFATIVRGEIVPPWWQRFLHADEAREAKAALLHEPGTVFIAVPYHL
jgi:ATP-binding protein involved in chromosome partitioning